MLLYFIPKILETNIKIHFNYYCLAICRIFYCTQNQSLKNAFIQNTGANLIHNIESQYFQTIQLRSSKKADLSLDRASIFANLDGSY